MHNQDRELQIKLAQLQADIQINLTVTFGFLAGFLALIIGYMQIYYSFSFQERLTLTGIAFSVMIVIISIVCWIFVGYFFKKVLVTRKKMEELKREYCW